LLLSTGWCQERIRA